MPKVPVMYLLKQALHSFGKWAPLTGACTRAVTLTEPLLQDPSKPVHVPLIFIAWRNEYQMKVTLWWLSRRLAPMAAFLQWSRSSEFEPVKIFKRALVSKLWGLGLEELVHRHPTQQFSHALYSTLRSESTCTYSCPLLTVPSVKWMSVICVCPAYASPPSGNSTSIFLSTL